MKKKKQNAKKYSSGKEKIGDGKTVTSNRNTDALEAASTNTNDDIFPANFQWLVFILTLLLRINYVSQKENWWLLHPDEVFQSIEVAFSELHGYGFRPYEYLPPPESGNETISVSRTQEIDMHMYSLRSFLVPRFCMIIYFLVSLIHDKFNPTLVWKLVHAAITSCLPLSVYHFTNVLCCSHDISVLSAVLVASSVHLCVFGTHTLINSLLSPAIFYVLAEILRIIVAVSNTTQDSKEKDRPPLRKADNDNSVAKETTKTKSNKAPENNHGLFMKQSGETIENNGDVALRSLKADHIPCDKVMYASGNRNTRVCNGIHYCGKASITSTVDEKLNVCTTTVSAENSRLSYLTADNVHAHNFNGLKTSSSRSKDLTADNVHAHNFNGLKTSNSRSKDLIADNVHAHNFNGFKTSNSKSKDLTADNAHAHIVNGLKTNNSKSKDLTADSVHANTVNGLRTSNSRSKESQHQLGHLRKTQYDLQMDQKVIDKVSNNSEDLGKSGKPKATVRLLNSSANFVGRQLVTYWILQFFKGMLCGLCLYIRPDTIIMFLVMIVPFLPCKYSQFCKIITNLHPYTIGLSAGVLIGIVDDFLSYRQLVLSPWQWIHFNVITNLSGSLFGRECFGFYIQGIFLQNFVMICLSVFALIGLLCSLLEKQDEKRFNYIIIRLTLAFVTSITIYSMNIHKELRFVHDSIVILFILYSCCLFRLYKFFLQIYEQELFIKSLTTIVFTVYLSGQYFYFPSARDNSNEPWVYQKLTDSNHVNICLDFVGHQNDVTGVFLDRSLHMSGGYSMLHRNVPIITLIYKEFEEFDVKSRVSFKPLYGLSPRSDNLSLSVLTKVSDFISVRNTAYLLKVLIEKSQYNYLLLKVNRKFIETGYREIYRSGTMRVLKRKFSVKDEQELKRIAEGIPLGSNSTVLNYEANWLLTYELFDLAEAKLRHSLTLDSKNIDAYKLLIELYKRTRNPTAGTKIYKKCKILFGNTECIQTPKRLVLHPEYNL